MLIPGYTYIIINMMYDIARYSNRSGISAGGFQFQQTSFWELLALLHLRSPLLECSGSHASNTRETRMEFRTYIAMCAIARHFRYSMTLFGLIFIHFCDLLVSSSIMMMF